MNLYIVSCEEWGYDDYDSFVVAARDKEEALNIAADSANNFKRYINQVEVDLIAEDSLYEEAGIIHSSFNAG